MPVWGLVITSIGFSIPALLAFRNKRKKMGRACSILTCTSILYHGTQHAICKAIDLCYAHSIGVFYGIKSIYHTICYRRTIDVIILLGTCGAVSLFYIGYTKSHPDEQNRYHMHFHILSQYMLSLHALDRNHKKELPT